VKYLIEEFYFCNFRPVDVLLVKHRQYHMECSYTESPPVKDTPQVETDEELFRRIGSHGGERAFHLLYERYSSRVYAYCTRMLGNVDEAKDAYQETFIRMFQRAGGETGRVRVAPYLFTIARNLCLNAIRSRKHMVTADALATVSEELALERTERARLVRLAIELLPLDYREPLILKEYFDFSYADIAATLDVPVSTVKIRIHRAKDRMRAILAPYFDEP
jgi:RNA polymerase sigma-70 factor, ECF subfamily